MSSCAGRGERLILLVARENGILSLLFSCSDIVMFGPGKGVVAVCHREKRHKCSRQCTVTTVAYESIEEQ